MRLVIVCLVFFITTVSYSQVQITLYSSSEPALTLEDGWNVSLQNLSGTTLILYLHTQYLNQEGQLIAEIKSQPLKIAPGENRFSPNQFSVASINYTEETSKQIVKRSRFLPDGIYHVCTSVFFPDQETALAVSCFDKQNASKQSINKISTNNLTISKLSSYGELMLEQYYTPHNQQNNSSGHPYTRLQGQAGFTLLDLPFKTQVRLSTEKNLPQTQPKAITFSFDATQFKSTLRKRLEEKILKQQEKELIERAEDIAKLKELEQLEQLLWTDSTRSRLSRISWLQNKTDNARITHWKDSLKQRDNDLQTLLSKIESIHQTENPEKAIGSELMKHLSKDSLIKVAVQIKIKKDSLLQVYQTSLSQVDTLRGQISTYTEWKSELKRLAAQQQEYKKLEARHDQLQLFKEKLQTSGHLPELTRNDADKLDDPEYLKKRLQDEGIVSKFQQRLMVLEELTIGTVYPQFSPLMLQGIPVDGASISVSGPVYVSAVGGKTQGNSFDPVTTSNGTDTSGFSIRSPNYRLAAGKIGIGKLNGTHLHVTALHTKIFPGQGEQLYDKNVSGMTYGVNTQLQIVPGYVVMQNYVAYLPLSVNDTTALLLRNLAYQTNLSLQSKKRNTHLKLSTRYIGPDYKTAGVPFLLSDRMIHTLQTEQWYQKRQLKTTLIYSVDRNNVLHDQPVTTWRMQKGVGLGVYLKNWPRLQFNYTQMTQREQEKTFTTDMWQFIGTKSYSINRLNAMLMAMYNVVNSLYDNPNTSLVNHHVQVSQTLMNAKMLSFSLNLHYQYRLNHDFRLYHLASSNFLIDYSYPGASENFHQAGVDALLSFYLTPKLNTTLGAQLWKDTVQGYSLGERVQFTWQLSRLLQIQGRAECNQNSIQNTFVDLSLKMNW